jgi:type IV secretion system protein TrbG
MTRNNKTCKAATMLAIIGLAAQPALAQQPAPMPPAGPPAAQKAEPEPQVIVIPVPLPLPGQLKPAPQAKPPHASGRSRPTRSPPAPVARVGAANEAARVEPRRDGFINAMQRFVWSEGALYQVYAAPGQITDIALQPGEQLVGAGPVAAGDTVRWVIGDTTSGTGNATRVHILVKPTRSDLATNLIINTDRRTYHLELRASISTYMASVSWTYPQDELIAIRGRASAAEAAATGDRCACSTTECGPSSSFQRASRAAKCRRCLLSVRAVKANWSTTAFPDTISSLIGSLPKPNSGWATNAASNGFA